MASFIMTEIFIPVMGPVIVPVFGPWWGGGLPPSFDDILLAYWDGTNTDATHKTDLINAYDMVAVEGPCLTLAIGDTMVLPMNDTPASNMGTAVFTYDGLTATVTTAGTIYKVMSTNGLEFPFNEGVGTTFRDKTGTYEGVITAASPGTMWTENTQDDYFAAMDYGWYENDPDDGGQYIYDPTTTPYFNLHLTVSGLGTLTIGSIGYTVGTYVLEDLFGATTIAAAYGSGEDSLEFTGDTVTGTYPNFSIDMDGNKAILGAFSASSSYDDITFYHNCNALGDAQKASGSPAVTYGSGITAVAATSPMIGYAWDTGTGTFSAATVTIDISGGNLSLLDGRIGFYWSPKTAYINGAEVLRGTSSNDLLVNRSTNSQTLTIKYRAGSTASIDMGAAVDEDDVRFIELRMDGATAELFVDGDSKGSASGSTAVTSTELYMTFTNPAAQQHFDQVIFSNDVDRDLYAVRNITDFG